MNMGQHGPASLQNLCYKSTESKDHSKLLSELTRIYEDYELVVVNFTWAFALDLIRRDNFKKGIFEALLPKEFVHLIRSVPSETQRI
jgi:hypothetical protein